MFALLYSVFRGLLVADDEDAAADHDAGSRAEEERTPKRSRNSDSPCDDDDDDDDDASLAGLSSDLKLIVMSFLYDDFDSLQALLSSCNACKLDPSTVKSSIRNDLLLRRSRHQENDDTVCSLCAQPVTYPYELVDCSHIACGRCAWFKSPNGRCGVCSTKIRSEPWRLGQEANRLADARAHWILSEQENALRRSKHDKRVHRGTAGFFGKKGLQSKRNPFGGKGFPADFDDMPTLHIDHLHLLPEDRTLGITVCRASRNYSAFPNVAGTAREIRRSLSVTNRVNHAWRPNDVIMIEAKRSRKSNAYEVRLVGWEHQK